MKSGLLTGFFINSRKIKGIVKKFAITIDFFAKCYIIVL